MQPSGSDGGPIGEARNACVNGPLQADALASQATIEKPPDLCTPNEEFTGLDSQQAVVLSPEQKKVLQMVKEGRNVFFTGSAGLIFFSFKTMERRLIYLLGTGKSVLLREIIKVLGSRPSLSLGITASTGIASVNIGGTTLHSWAGIGLGLESAEKLAGKIFGQQKLEKVLERWQTVKTLIIDESKLTQVIYHASD